MSNNKDPEDLLDEILNGLVVGVSENIRKLYKDIENAEGYTNEIKLGIETAHLAIKQLIDQKCTEARQIELKKLSAALRGKVKPQYSQSAFRTEVNKLIDKRLAQLTTKQDLKNELN